MFPVHGGVAGRVSGRVGIQEGRAYTEGVVRPLSSDSFRTLIFLRYMSKSNDLIRHLTSQAVFRLSFYPSITFPHPTALMSNLSTDTDFCYRRGRRYSSSDSLRQMYLSPQLHPMAACRLQTKTPAERCNWRLI
jgi:hypothetical protein